MRETSREGGCEGDKGQSHTITLCSVELQRPTCYSHAMLNFKFLSSLPLSSPTLFISQFIQITKIMSRYSKCYLAYRYAHFEICTAESPAIITVMEENLICFVVLVNLEKQTVFMGNQS